MKFLVIYELKPNGAMSYNVDAESATEARKIAESWQKIQAPTTRIRKVVVKELKS